MLSHLVVSTFCDPMNCSLPGSSVHGDSPGKNTGMGCHFLFQCMKVKSESEVAQSCSTLSDPMDCSLPGSSVHGDSPGKNTGVGCQALLQGISPTQGLNPGLPHCRQILYCLSHQGDTKLELSKLLNKLTSSNPYQWQGCIK